MAVFSIAQKSGKLAFAAAVALAPAVGFAGAANGAGALLQRGEADQALTTLQQSLRVNASDATALNLECRVYFSEDALQQAEPACEQAVALQPGNSNYHLWLGRVLGRQAEHAPALSAFGLAKKVRKQFEEAYQLAPHNAEAAADLAEFYTDAPRILGGGDDKAQAISAQVAPWAPALSHNILAGVAEKNKQPAEAEAQLRQAAASPDATPSDYVALASFYRKQGQTAKMLAAVDKAVSLDTQHDDALVSAAEQLTKSNQRPAQVISLLQQYLASPDQSEQDPAFRVRAQLSHLLASAGQPALAQQQLAMAHALASQWQPAEHTGS